MADGQLVEKVADEIDDVAFHVEEVAEATRSLTGREVGFFLVGAGIGIAIGFTVGYKVAEKRLQTKYSKLAEEEISEMREHYQQKMVAVEPKPPLDKVMKERYSEVELQAIKETNAQFPPEEEVQEGVVVQEVEETTQVNVFDSEDWNYAAEIAKRDPEVPYIIHVDEFSQNEPEHDQLTYTYYEVDDVLADQQENTIDDMDAVIGLGNLGRWGHGSKDEHIVYIRNEEMKTDFEVVRDRWKFCRRDSQEYPALI